MAVILRTTLPYITIWFQHADHHYITHEPNICYTDSLIWTLNVHSLVGWFASGITQKTTERIPK